MVLEVLRESKAKHPEIPSVLERMEDDDYWSDLGDVNVCVCSFSEAYDSLPQWRAYSSASSGFSLCFKGDFLKEVSEINSFYMAPCVYKEEEQVKLLHSALDRVIYEYERDKAIVKMTEYGPVNILSVFNGVMYRVAPVIKDVSFKDEKEWRIITRPMMCSLDGYDYRPGASMIIPYFKVPLKNRDSNFVLESVLVGPTPNPDRSMKSVRSLLVSKRRRSGQVGLRVDITKVP